MKTGIFQHGKKDPTARTVGSDPFLLRELAACSENGVIVGINGERTAYVSKDRVIIADFVEDDLFSADGRKDFDRSWSYLRHAEMRHRFELAYLLTMEWRPDEGEWLSLLDAMAREADG